MNQQARTSIHRLNEKAITRQKIASRDGRLREHGLRVEELTVSANLFLDIDTAGAGGDLYDEAADADTGDAGDVVVTTFLSELGGRPSRRAGSCPPIRSRNGFARCGSSLTLGTDTTRLLSRRWINGVPSNVPRSAGWHHDVVIDVRRDPE